MTQPARKLRVLCLHGYHGSAAVLRSQLLPLITGTESLVDYVLVDAPARASGDFGWWHAVDTPNSSPREDPGVSGSRHYLGWGRTHEWLATLFAEQGPFDGVLGFSQGAALTGLLAGLRAPSGNATAERPVQFDFAVVISGFPSVDPDHAQLYQSKDSFDVPSLHIVGRNDFLVPPPLSFDLASRFTSPVILEHAGGHIITGTAEVRAGYRQFIEDRVAAKTETTAPRPAHQRTVEVPLWLPHEHPRLTVVFPERVSSAPTPAVVVFRGGAYATSAGSGAGSIEWLASQGVVGVQVDYRTQGAADAFPAHYADAARAVRMVRQRAAEWNIDPDRVGVLGYSAGGHLASLLSTQPELPALYDDELAETISARPDLVILAYPLISFVEGYQPGAFAGSVDNFFGLPDAPENLRERFSNELNVDPTHPPVFIWTTREDTIVPYTHSQLFVDACISSGVPVRYELYQQGPHGMGLAFDRQTEVRGWTDQLRAWLTEQWGSSQ